MAHKLIEGVSLPHCGKLIFMKWCIESTDEKLSLLITKWNNL